MTTKMAAIQPHNERPATVWSSGGADYDRISRGIADSLEHCVLRLDPKPGEKILDVATGTGWTSRLVARCGARVTGVDIASDLLAAARARAAADGLAIAYERGDAEDLPFDDAAFGSSWPRSPASRHQARWRAGCSASPSASVAMRKPAADCSS